jgi:hypothetical protein
LKLTFLLAVILFVFELILMFHKNHFYNALVYVAIFSIVLLGYFDKYYIKFILVNLLVSIVLDFLWVILQASVIFLLQSHIGTLILPHIILRYKPPS